MIRKNNQKLLTTSYSWDIRNFAYLIMLYEPGDALRWPLFYSQSNNKAWKLHIYPKGKSCEDYVSFYLSKLNPSSQTIYNCKLSIGRPGATPVKSFEYIGIQLWNNIIGEEFFLLKKSNNWIERGPVRFQCDITEIGQKNPDLNPIDFHLELPDISNLSSELGVLLQIAFHSDLTVNMNGNEIYIHKYMLCARCPKLSFEFGYRTIMEMPPIVYTEINYEIFEILMHYIYTGKLKDSPIPLELFRLAERLSLLSLMKCVHEQAYSFHVCSEPSVENHQISWNLDELNFLEGSSDCVHVLKTNLYVANMVVQLSVIEDIGSEKLIHISFAVFRLLTHKPLVLISKISLTSQAGIEAYSKAHHVFSNSKQWNFPPIPCKTSGKNMCLTAELNISDGSNYRKLTDIKTKIKLYTDFQTVTENLECLRLNMDLFYLMGRGTSNLILLSADKKKFPVHDGILWARWPGVNKKIDRSSVSSDEEMNEIENQLEVNIPSEVLNDLLLYSYTGFIFKFDRSKAEVLLKYSKLMEYPHHLVEKCRAVLSNVSEN